MPIIRGMRGESSHIDDMMVIRPDGTKTLLEIYGSPVLDHRNQIAASLVSFMDITGRRNAEEEIKKQLLEKETLLKEVHHRIKNNISSIECLLALQADASDNSDAKTALHEAISRIQSIRILYDKLLIENDYQNISIKHYAENLVDSIVEMFTENKNVIVEKRIIDFTISSKKVIPLGIIINELLTNVFKYAFKGKENGRVVIEIEKDEQRITLTIRDDGVGIETADNAVKPQGFGLTIVKMLTEQLNGTYTFENDNGTKSAVVFEL
jgi:two-component sensor histidine kinase